MFNRGLHDDAFYIAYKLKETLGLKDNYSVDNTRGVYRMVIECMDDEYYVIIATPTNTIIERLLGYHPQRYVVVWNSGAVDGDTPVLTLFSRNIQQLINEVKFAWKDK